MMNMSNKRLAVESAIGGIAITLLSFLYDSTPHIVGAVWHGFPLTWMRYLLVGPQYNPWAVDYFGLVVDVVAWSAVVAAVLILLRRLRQKKQ